VFYIGNLETERHEERCGCYLCKDKENVLHLLQKRNETQRWKEQFLDNRRLHINEVTAYVKIFCNKITELRTLGQFDTQSKRQGKKLVTKNVQVLGKIKEREGIVHRNILLYSFIFIPLDEINTLQKTEIKIYFRH
jgi:hypothetical protein